MGSNPGDAKFDHRFSFGDWVDCKKETVTTTITTITRGDSNQPSSIWICGAIFNIVRILMLCYKQDNIDLRWSKRGSPLGLPT